MKFSFIKYGIVLAVLGGFYMYWQYDRAANYERVEAIVTKVEEICYLKKTEGKTTYTTDEGPCETLEVLSEVHPEFQGFTLKRVNYVTFDYISPVDGDWYSGKHKQARHEDGSWIREGDKLAILAHKTEPKKIAKM